MNRSILITGGDEKFGVLLLEAVESLRDCGALSSVDLGVLDQGLGTPSLSELQRMGAKVVRPDWPHFVPLELRNPIFLGLACRPLLRDIFPGYDTYVWFDADAWAQNVSFVEAYLSGARHRGAAVAREDGCGYHKSMRDKRWWFGNHVLAFGATKGLHLILMSSVNIGILSLSSSAPHWSKWLERYIQAIQRTAKINLDQHAFHAAIHLDGLQTTFLPATDNWIPILSVPAWDATRRRLCEPSQERKPISVIHLAGPDKDRAYELSASIHSPLRYSNMSDLIQR